MHRQIRRVFAAGGAALSALGIAVASVACGGTSTAPQAPQPSAPPATQLQPSGPPGAQLWIQRYKLPPRTGPGFVQVVAVSPRGDKVYMTGEGATVAYSAATGARLWAGHGGASVAVSPDGATVFVIGGAGNPGQHGPQGSDYATAAYNAATGKQLWASRYNAPGKPGGYGGGPKSVVVSPGGDRVFVTGISVGAGSGPDYATVAYSASTGAQLWATRYNGPGNAQEIMFPGGPQNEAVSRDGATVYVTGASKGTGPGLDFATVAYSAATGKQLWVSRYHGPTGDSGGTAIAVSPGGSTVFVTGGSQGAGSGSDYGTLAYNAATGKQLWASRYNGPGNRDDASVAIAVSPDGRTVFVTGNSTGTAATGEDYATIAYNAATGARRWLQRYNGPASRGDNAWGMAVSPSGAKLYVTGHDPADGSGATVAYNPSTGAQLWVTRYTGYSATAVAVTPDGATVFVAGYSHAPAGYATVAYRG